MKPTKTFCTPMSTSSPMSSTSPIPSMILVVMAMSFCSIVATATAAGNTLCDRIKNGQIRDLNLQSTTYLKFLTEDEVFLMADYQLYGLSAKYLSPDGNNPLTPKGDHFWKDTKVLKWLTTNGKPPKTYKDEQVDLISVLYMYRNTKPGSFVKYNFYNVMVRTKARVHVIEFDGSEETSIYNSGETDTFPNVYPHYTVIPRTIEGYLELYWQSYTLVQDDKLFHATGSPVFYVLQFGGRVPKLAMTLTDTEPASRGGTKPEGERQQPYYFVCNSISDNSAEVRMLSTWGAEYEQAIKQAREWPLLHRVPLGFQTPDKRLVLIEPDIGCVYTVDGFTGLRDGVTLKVKRVPIERYFRCSDAPIDLTAKGYPSDRCDSPLKVNQFYGSKNKPEKKDNNSSSGSSNGNGTDENSPNDGTGEPGSGVRWPKGQNLLLFALIGAGVVLALVVLVVVCYMVNKPGSGKKGKGALHKKKIVIKNQDLKHNDNKFITKTVTVGNTSTGAATGTTTSPTNATGTTSPRTTTSPTTTHRTHTRTHTGHTVGRKK